MVTNTENTPDNELLLQIFPNNHNIPVIQIRIHLNSDISFTISCHNSQSSAPNSSGIHMDIDSNDITKQGDTAESEDGTDSIDDTSSISSEPANIGDHLTPPTTSDDGAGDSDR